MTGMDVLSGLVLAGMFVLVVNVLGGGLGWWHRQVPSSARRAAQHHDRGGNKA